MQIYMVAHDGKGLKQLTSGVQGATHSPVFSPSGDKAAWLELAEDGHESDRWVMCSDPNLYPLIRPCIYSPMHILTSLINFYL
jgi:Tol biopolymer transport system component